mmetsp:Transcript_688/g.1400  ORF Transcript_688/g.1400 Transcript_688/m.1400 type:complete len:490 (+) Transcript_688:122-1591(+)|eukprot:CAMPEP_0178436980 /NCGR_PEP_ID=MMETSP0689_2-20121128/34726_1 /TAXON_ID=160604 /ORGANISM="Amphidinium massartii, Strain CS-259" /LENGTH=489 /DNA_ID=CAMNT_0020059107 /DNA_START=37 /DNA_END=1506 /DNA_ORIENTATION=-
MANMDSEDQEQKAALVPKGWVASAEAADLESAEKVPQQSAAASPDRVYYIDWLRVMAVYLVVVFHSIQACTAIHLWEETSSSKRAIIAFRSTCLQFGIPLFFQIAGRARALAKPKGIFESVVTRGLRLVPPLLIGWAFLVVPFWQFPYIPTEHEDAPTSFLPFLHWFFKPGHFIFTLSWLWFLPVLFCVEVAALPFVLFADHKSPLAGLAAMTVLLGLCAFGYFLCGLGLIFCMFLLLGPCFALALVLLVDVPQAGVRRTPWRPSHWMAVHGLTLVMMASQVGMVCSFGYADLAKAHADPMTPAIVMFFEFYLLGFFLQRWGQDPTDILLAPSTSEPVGLLKAAKLITAMLPAAYVVGICAGASTGDWEAGLFPIYSASYSGGAYFAAMYVIGTWSGIGLSVPGVRGMSDMEVDPSIYRHMTGSAIVVYVFHYAFIQSFAYWGLLANGLTFGVWKVLSPLLLFTFGLGGPLCVYALMTRCKILGKLFGV